MCCRSIISELTPNGEAWKTALELRIDQQIYVVVYNPPTVDKVCAVDIAGVRAALG